MQGNQMQLETGSPGFISFELCGECWSKSEEAERLASSEANPLHLIC